MTKISQWISSYRSSSTLLSIEPDAGEASNCCWCLCNCPWSLVTRSSNKLWTNNKVASLFLNCFGKVRLFLCDSFIDSHSLLFFLYLPCEKRYAVFCSNPPQHAYAGQLVTELVSVIFLQLTYFLFFPRGHTIGSLCYFNKIRSNQLGSYLLNSLSPQFSALFWLFLAG